VWGPGPHTGVDFEKRLNTGLRKEVVWTAGAAILRNSAGQRFLRNPFQSPREGEMGPTEPGRQSPALTIEVLGPGPL
jgi:hypothetical protein